MFKSILISTVMLLLLAGLTFSQTDLAPDSKVIISGTEKTFPGDIVDSKVNTSVEVPQYLLDQLEIANETENLEEENRIMNIINTHYSEGVPANTTEGLMPDETSISGNNNPPYSPDWVSPDVLVWTGSGGSATRRTMDMKMGEDGNMYLAFCWNGGTSHGVRILRSTNWGLNWTTVHTLTGSSYYTGLSMTVERRHASNNDSIRVNVFFTYSTTGSNNASGRLRLMSCRIGSGTGQNIFLNIDSPGSGNQYRWPSAVSNGAFESTSTDIGIVLGEYNNPLTNEINLKYFYTSNFSWSFSEYTWVQGNVDYWPSAAYKDRNGTDSVFFIVERDLGSNRQLRLIQMRFVSPGNSWNWETVTTNSSYSYREPSFNIPQRKWGCNKMMVTYTRRSSETTTLGLPRYSYSNNGAASWSIDFVLGGSYTSRTTWLNSDTNQSGNYYVSVFGDTDSLNVRRGVPGSMGTYNYKRNSNLVTATYIPVCAVYTYWGTSTKRSAIAFWQSGPTNVYYDGENLPSGITNTNGTANSYSLSQNFPNPFNPTTSINFSIPQDGLVKLVVYDVLGKEVATLVNNEQTAGNYQVTFDASKLTSGVYFYKITSGDFSDVKKMLLVK